MYKTKSLSFLEKASLVLAIMLVFCLFPLPYGFYIILRLAVSIIGSCWAYHFYKNNRVSLAIIALGIVILFQPLIKIVLDRTTWNIIDIILVLLLFSVVLSKKKQSEKV